MKALERLFERIAQRVTINLREFGFDVHPYAEQLVPFEKLSNFYGFYGVSSQHPLDFKFLHSNLAGSYFLGKCRTTNSIVYKSDIRGDELKKKGEVFKAQGFQIPLTRDEGIRIEDSFLVKTLVHNHSHDPEHPERFPICNTIACRYCNIHGSPMDGSFLEPFATIDLTTMNDCIVGAFSYIQAGEVHHLRIAPGTIWVKSPGNFNFLYQYPKDSLRRYVQFASGFPAEGLLMEFVHERKEDFQRVYATVNVDIGIPVPKNTSVDRYAVIKPETCISENVLVAQRAFLENSRLGKGANAQENCYIINSNLAGYDVTAHGAKVVEVDMGEMVFVGFNSFLRGRPDARLAIGRDSIIMPHTIIDSDRPLHIPDGSLVWGLVTGPEDLAKNSISLEELRGIEGGFSRGSMFFEGSGFDFVDAFCTRIQHILAANGAFYDGNSGRGHAQKNQNISFNTIQPYSEGALKGMFPTIDILP